MPANARSREPRCRRHAEQPTFDVSSLTRSGEWRSFEESVGNSAESPGRRRPVVEHQTERGNVSDHQDGYIDDRDYIGCAQLARQFREVQLDAMEVVNKDVGCSHRIEGNHE